MKATLMEGDKVVSIRESAGPCTDEALQGFGKAAFGKKWEELKIVIGQKELDELRAERRAVSRRIFGFPKRMMIEVRPQSAMGIPLEVRP